MTLRHVSVLRLANTYSVKVGIFLTAPGWQTAEMLKLPKDTQWEGLTEERANELAVLLEAYIEANQVKRKGKR